MQEQTTEGLAKDIWVSRIAASAFDMGTVYLSQNGKRNDDFAAYLWKSTNYGLSWMDITGNIPCGPINVVREDPKNENILYVGTDLGAYVTVDGGKTWNTLSTNFPTTFVHDLVIHPREDILVAATHGRGMWAMDARTLQKMTPEILARDGHLFEIPSAKLPRRTWRRWGGGQDAVITYYLKDAQKVKLVFKDGSGNVVKEIEKSGKAGLNITFWDLTKQDGQEDQPRGNPYVRAGDYTVIITAGSLTLEGTVEVEK
jgi:hypothetical protein